jgi:hypothetical protein
MDTATLFEMTGSPVAADTTPTFTTSSLQSSAAGASALSASGALACAARAPTDHVMASATVVPVGLEPCTEKPAGKRSRTLTPLAPSGPRFVAVNVNGRACAAAAEEAVLWSESVRSAVAGAEGGSTTHSGVKSAK